MIMVTFPDSIPRFYIHTVHTADVCLSYCHGLLGPVEPTSCLRQGGPSVSTGWDGARGGPRPWSMP